MEICEVVEYGLFDTKTAFPGKRKTSGRLVTEYEIEFFTSVTGKAIIDGKSYDISPGTLVCACPGQIRASVFDFQCCYMHLTFPKNSPYRELMESVPSFYRIIDRDAYGRLFEDLIHHLLSVGYSKDSDFVNAKLLELFYYLRKDAQRNRNYLAHVGTQKNFDAAIPHAVDFIRENYRRELSLADIAYVTGYSPNYFHRMFTEIMGKTPLQYLLQVRIRHARYLLAQSDKSLSEIAYECGFSSQAYFTEQFKKATYSTPGQYRKRCMAQYRP